MSDVRARDPADQPMFDYLEKLRLSGAVNMFGAAPYLANEFGLLQGHAKKVLVAWMEAHVDARVKTHGT